MRRDYDGLERLDRPELDDDHTEIVVVGMLAMSLACSTHPLETPATDGSAGEASQESGVLGDAGQPEADAGCENLECQISACDGGDGTTISGTVYDPPARSGLYNVFVYVPNKPLEAILDGPTCDICQARASGKPIASSLTDANGHFRITHAPSGNNIPLVMQLGKWRRKIFLPAVAPCTDNALDPVADKEKTRLPRKEAEFGEKNNHIPKIAFTTGCDMAQCFLLDRIGIDVNEFSGPGGSGRVHVYGGQGYSDSMYGPPNMGDAYALWGNASTLAKYDIVMSSCECNAYARDAQGPGYANLKTYLDGGGRVFATHFQYNFFASDAQCALGSGNNGTCKGPSAFNNVADWSGEAPSSDTDYLIDTSFPKGKAFADWLDNVTPVNKKNYGHIALIDTRINLKSPVVPTSRWIYTQNAPYYVSFNTPVGVPPANQCGRAVFSGAHVAGSYYAQTGFPQFCGTNPWVDHSANEEAMEFLFFDLSSCVQDDTKPPPDPK